MRCDRVQVLYDDYTRASLPLTVMSRIEEHLAGCPACRELFEQNDAVAQMLRRSSEIAHPGPQYFDDLASRVLERLEAVPGAGEEAASKPPPQGSAASWRRPLWWAGGLSAAALLALGLMPAVSPSSTESITLAQARAAVSHPPPTRTVAASTSPLSIAAASAPSAAPQTRLADAAHAMMSLWLPGLVSPDSRVAANQTIEKGLARGAGGAAASPTVQVAAASSTPLEGAGAGGKGKGSAAGASDQAPARPVEVKPVAARPAAAAKPAAMPDDVLRQVQAIKAQMLSGGIDAMQKGLQDLQAEIDQTGAAGDQGPSWARQLRLYARAEREMSQGNPSGAMTYFKMTIDDAGPSKELTTPMGVLAALELGDLFYSEWADFRTARDYYRQCSTARVADALSADERRHVAHQLDLLDKYEKNTWEPLLLMHIVSREGWVETKTALGKLLAEQDAAALLPEAARTVVERMNTAPKPTAQTAYDIYNLLAKHLDVEQNGEIRAWLELSLGDLALAQFKEPGQAMEYYRKAAGDSADTAESGAAHTAKSKLEVLVERQLIDQVRH